MGIKATVVQSALNRPSILGEGDIDATLLWEWFTKCENYLQHKDISGLAMTKSVAYGMSSMRMIHWLTANGPLLDMMEWDDYKDQMHSLFLPSDWEHTTRMDILRFHQNFKIFIDYAFKVMGKNNLLAGTDSFMNNEFMHETIKARMESELSRECSHGGLGQVESFKTWLDEVKHINKHCQQQFEEMSAAIAKLAIKPAATTRTPFIHHGTPMTNPHTMNTTPMPKLTESECQLLSSNSSCYKCRKFWAGHIGP
ncbi:hypothetical protein BDN71DRAFT_1511847 [Pleurotus eryngii]|uniref:Uncharacterized protein n=1 Tax=Pleurotus eryngii TaxID=5323 RepID=A0A9P5ZPY9_PLEER|nr:hypothetical protein BDN71DRAFT_1511847 [Pleurotus eryngii]